MTAYRKSLAFISMLMVGLVTTADAAGIRFYKLNNKGQENELMFVMNADEPGCHNLGPFAKAHRVAQVGFGWCEVFREKDCAPGSQYWVNWTGSRKKDPDKKKPTVQFSEGANWMINKTENVPVKSWNCIPKSGN